MNSCTVDEDLLLIKLLVCWIGKWREDQEIWRLYCMHRLYDIW